MKRRLTWETVSVESLDEAARSRMLALMQQCYEGVEPARFHDDLASKQYVILLRDRATGALAGFSNFVLEPIEREGRKGELLYSGDTVIHPHYWGQKTLHRAFSLFLVWRKLRRPFSPLLWLLLSAGFRTYLLLVNYFRFASPKRDVTPDARDVAEMAAHCRRRFGPQYDEARGVVRLVGHYHVKPGVVPIDAQALADPHISFFLEKNPGHAEGDELVCFVRVRDLVNLVLRLGGKALGRGRRLVGAPESRA